VKTTGESKGWPPVRQGWYPDKKQLSPCRFYRYIYLKLNLVMREKNGQSGGSTKEDIDSG
jgi:hypothetical protein